MGQARDGALKRIFTLVFAHVHNYAQPLPQHFNGNPGIPLVAAPISLLCIRAYFEQPGYRFLLGFAPP